MSELNRAVIKRTDPEADAAMERYARGDDAAFAELYDRVAPRLHAYLLRRTRDQTRTDDLMQQTFMQVHRARGRFIPGAEVMPWMYAIAHRLMIDAVRKDGRARVLLGDDGQVVAICDRDAADDVMHVKQLAKRVDEELERIPESQRAAFELVKQEGLSLKAAAEALGTTVPSVKLRAHRAYQALRRALGQDVGSEP